MNDLTFESQLEDTASQSLSFFLHKAVCFKMVKVYSGMLSLGASEKDSGSQTLFSLQPHQSI